MNRHFWVLFHRYAGLFMAFYLIVIGLTGSIIVFNPELNEWFTPSPKVTPHNAPLLDAFALRDHALAAQPHAKITSLNFQIKPNEAYNLSIEPKINPATQEAYELDATSLWLDPYTGEILKQEKFSEEIWPITSKNVMVLINRLHYSLALPGSWGVWLFGIVALIWAIDCFVSAYLTFPLRSNRANSNNETPKQKKRHRKSWLARWKIAWLIKWRSSAYRINFDLHRAGGLWVWFILLAFAWSSVGFNLGEQIYMPVMKFVFNMPDPSGDTPTLEKPPQEPDLDLAKAHLIAKTLMTEQANLNHFSIEHEEFLWFQAEKNSYLYVVRSSRDLNDEGGGTLLTFDASSGKFIGLSLPTGQNIGSTIHSWIFAIHMAQIWGMPFRIFIVLMGFLVAMLSITGIYIWIKKRSARQL